MRCYTAADARADLAFLVGARYGRGAQMTDVLAWLDEQMDALPDRREPSAHGKAELIRDLREHFSGVFS